jgi:hypothetical protein
MSIFAFIREPAPADLQNHPDISVPPARVQIQQLSRAPHLQFLPALGGRATSISLRGFVIAPPLAQYLAGAGARRLTAYTRVPEDPE